MLVLSLYNVMVITNRLTFPFLLGFTFVLEGAGAFLLAFFLVRVGGRGDAHRLARGPDASDPVAWSGVKREVRESFGGTTKPGSLRAGLGGRRVNRRAEDGRELLFGTWRLSKLELSW